jgi:predicted O-methyltransferase YrrM
MKYRKVYNERALQEMHPLLRQILYTRKVVTSSGEERDLSGEISRQEGLFLYDLITSNPDIHSVLEIGLAMGVSSLFMQCAIKEISHPVRHMIIDPFQTAHFAGAGVTALQRADFSGYQLVEKLSEEVLPELWRQGETFDFVLQDGVHTFDHSMVEFFYLDKIINVGGLLVYDDCDFNPLNKFTSIP